MEIFLACIFPPLKNSVCATGERAQQLRTLAVLLEDPGPDPSTHIRWLTTICNFNSRGSGLSGYIYAPGVHKHTQAHIHA